MHLLYLYKLQKSARRTRFVLTNLLHYAMMDMLGGL